jgi:ATP-dependent RNA helicase DeaD
MLHRSGRTGRAGRKGLCLLLVPNSKRRRAELLLGSANIEADWQDPPTPEQIRTRDQERLLEDELLTQVPAADELSLAQALLARQSPEAIAAALIRMYRARLPEPASITIQTAPPPRSFSEAPRPVRAPRENAPFERRTDNAEMAWFRAPTGRKNNADPKWLIPLICRLGGITKQEIGVIRIFDRETKFEIVQEAANRFANSIATSSKADIEIERSTAPSAGPARDLGPRPAKVKFTRPERPANAKPTEQERRRKNKAIKGGY